MPSKTKNSIPQKLLVIRLSAIGDVAMTVPSLWSISQNYPDVQVTLVSQGFARDIVDQIPGILFFEADTKKRHKGLRGLIRLFNDLKRLDSFDAVADLHDVIRSKFVRMLFRLKGVRVVKIDKGRKEKQDLCREKNKQLVELKPTSERYADVFRKLNLRIDDSFDYFFREARLSNEISIDLGYKEGNWIGIAPFAKHKGKIYPLELMEKVLEKLSSIKTNKVILIGGGGEEKKLLENWANKYPNTISIARKYSISEELQIISNLDVLVCMDSANMHFASLVNTPVVSVWGATHPYAGFYGWKQNPENAVQIDLNCRPCSVYGNKPCFRKDYACLNRITPEFVLNKINTLLNQHVG
ncbi:glycosyl transferase family 1 [Tenuifilaceae bacterium CYCD]|nr:glycosyl transferase family 1 [Tenuifilaceae bacterium CYCD]